MAVYFDADILYDSEGRAYRNKFVIKRVPNFIYLMGIFNGKFFSDKVSTSNEKQELYEFKIYEAEVEILDRSHKPLLPIDLGQKAVRLNPEQLPKKIYFYKKIGERKDYFDLDFQDPTFYNFRFNRLLQQTEDKEAFGTVEAEIYGYIVKIVEEEVYEKEYLHFDTDEDRGDGIADHPTSPTSPTSPTIKIKSNTKSNTNVRIGSRLLNKTKQEVVSPCFRRLLLALLATLFFLMIGFTPGFMINLIVLLYIIQKCYFNLLKYLVYLLGIVFFVGLIYSISKINWHKPLKAPYIPKSVTQKNLKPQLVKLIRLQSSDSKKGDMVISRRFTWKGYRDEVYDGEFFILNSELMASRLYKNNLSYHSYPQVLYSLYKNDENRLEGLYHMFNNIKIHQHLSDKQFVEMIVSFVQHIPYYLVLDKSCNINDYQDNNVRNILRQNQNRCTPYQKFGITTPTEFMATLQGDCDSRTILLYTILKHFNYDVAIFTSDYYKHSILGVNIPYNGIKYNVMNKNYVLWETTDIYKPGYLPSQITNLDYWYLTLK